MTSELKVGSVFTNKDSKLIIKTSDLVVLFPDKRHSDIMQAAEKLFTKLEMGTTVFSGLYSSSQGRELPCYDMPYDVGITLIGFFDSALQYRINQEYIQLTGGRIIESNNGRLGLGEMQGGQIHELKQMVYMLLENQAKTTSLVDKILGVTQKKIELEVKREITYKTIHQWLDEHTDEKFSTREMTKIHKAFYAEFPDHLEHAHSVKQNNMSVYDTSWLDSNRDKIFNIIVVLFPSKD